MTARTWCAVLASLLLGPLAACGGGLAVDDQLAAIPTRIDAELVEPAPLRIEWTVDAPVVDTVDQIPTQGPGLDEVAVYVVYGNRVVAHAVADGELLWELTLDAPVMAAPIAYGGGIALATADAWVLADRDGRLLGTLAAPAAPDTSVLVGEVIVSLAAGRLRAIGTPSVGGSPTLLWEKDWEEGRALAAGPAGRQVVVVGEETGAAAFAVADGARRWHRADLTVAGVQPAIGARRAYVVGHDTRIRALDLSDGDTAWTSKPTGVQVRGAPVMLEGVLWVPGLDAGLHGYDAGGGSHWFRLPLSGRAYLPLVQWGRWVVASPQYGPWMTVRGPLTSSGPGNPGSPRAVSIASGADLDFAPAVGKLGLATVDAQGRIRLLRPPPWTRETAR